MRPTRWWWVRHAPVATDRSLFYGRSDVPSDTGKVEVYAALARTLPQRAVLLASPLRRTHETAAAIIAQGLSLPPPIIEPELIEQDFGAWTGRKRAEVFAALGPRDAVWTAAGRPPEGESYLELLVRVHRAIRQHTEAQTGRDIVSISHAGVIRAAVALALGLDPDRALTVKIDNCSLTRLEHLADGQGPGHWTVVCVNQRLG